MKRFLFTVFFILTFFAVRSNPLTVTGKVVDEVTGTPVEYASVFFANTTIGTITDSSGFFTLINSQKGVFELVISHLSYQTYMENISLENDSLNIFVKLKIKAYEIKPVVFIIDDPNRNANLRIFKTGVIGTSENSLYCKIVNPSTLRFYKTYEYENPDEWILKATADSVLVIQNDALGYTIKYNLENFLVHRRSNTMERIFYGYPLFEDLLNKARYPKQISKSRKLAYQGSKLHFFRSLYSHRLKQEGFEIFRIREKPARVNDTQDYGLLADSVFIGKPKVVLEQTEERLNLYNYLVSDSISGSVILSINEPFEVRYVKRGEDNRYYQSKYYSTGLKIRLSSQSSIINLRSGNIRIYQNGSYEKADELVTIGYWSYKKMADSLPFNYVYKR
jgi:hypothetical protein